MSCHHPLKAFYRLNDNGKKDIVFASSEHEKNLSMVVRGNILYPNTIDIPCGRCAGCRLEYARQWAVRCVLEALQYEYNYFVTLTYNDDNLPHFRNLTYDKDTGDVVADFISHSLVPEHLTLFIKRLRRYFQYHFGEDNIRFYACGEYGSKSLRPHYHIILFNCNIRDLEFLKNNFNGDSYFTSNTLNSLWPFGYVVVAGVTFQSCSYVARYMMKKLKGDNSIFYNENGLFPPFSRCSRMPGLARSYYDENRDKIYEFDKIYLASNGKTLRIRPPSYYDKLYDIECPEDFSLLKKKRLSSAENSMNKLISLSSKDKYAILEDQEFCLLSRIESLKRDL